ncbi:hypothetical protein [Litorisediminicola beolgyonensis]|uniref:Uncharacterized protein n=1 Tax=Litorisediminicola beolgyonensis TaxID=1173614 RepID=A0ABW3ZCR3_9RHOB
MRTDALILAYGLCFLAGPLIFLMALRADPGRSTALALGILVLAALVLAARLQSTTPAAALAALWLAWVGTVALLARAARARLTDPRTRRWGLVAGLLATTVPWFGLATALWMTA